MHWEAGSLPDLVSNLVKCWEKEASYKSHPVDWRTIDVERYRFSVNGGEEVSLAFAVALLLRRSQGAYHNVQRDI